MTQRERSRKARRKWQKLISEQARSGQSVAAFCRERELGRSHFWWWKKRLRTPLRKFVEVKLTRAVPEGAGMGAASRAEVLARLEEGRYPSGKPTFRDKVALCIRPVRRVSSLSRLRLGVAWRAS